MRLLYLVTMLKVFFITNSVAEIKEAFAYFANIGGRYAYEANFDKNDDIEHLLRVNDFKNLKSSNGCFEINVFDKNGKIYQFMTKKNLKVFCNN